MPQKITYRLKRDKLPGGDEIWTGYLSIPTVTAVPGMPGMLRPGKPIKLKATEKSPGNAMGSATSAAMKLLDNPMVRDLLPPGTQSAIAVAKKLVSSKAAGKAIKGATKAATSFLKSLW